jgi:stearoyl-CoA 9-desaturase NADPH oxidoreductase
MFTETPARRLLRSAVALVDAVAAPHGVDAYVEQVLPTWSTREIRARVVGVRRTTPSSVTLTLRANAGWTGFRAGQHTTLSVEIDGVRHSRCYSLANAEGRTRTFELTVKAHPYGVVSNYLVEHAAPGLVVGLTPAEGDFVLPSPRPDRVLLISGGSGVTPVMSMLRTLCAEGYAGAVTFVHYALTRDDHLYRDEVAALAAVNHTVRVVTIYTEAPGTGDLDGFFSAEQLDAIEPEWPIAETYVCGPAPLMTSVREHYASAGLAHRYHDEAFTLVTEATGGTVSFATSDTTAVDDGRPLLEQAEAAGLAPEYGCRMGICHTCTRQLLCGTVRDMRTGELTDGNGDIRICVSAPVGDVSVDL